MTNESIYQKMTDKILEKLEKGVIPWKQSWKGMGLPKNVVTKKPYRGINALMLFSEDFNSPYWLTFKQAKTLGGAVKTGEKGTQVVFWKWLEKLDAEGKPQKIPLLKHYTLFNALQCDGLEIEPIKEEPRTLESCEKLVSDFLSKEKTLKLTHNKTQPCYLPGADEVNLPLLSSFRSVEDYYHTMFHELTHATGHSTRLDRGFDKSQSFGSEDYSKEELIAELGACFLSGHSGIAAKTIDDSASYINGWIKALKDDKKMLVHAGAKAQQAADYILGSPIDAN